MVRAIHLLQLTTLSLICVILNIQNVLHWLKCKHGLSHYSCNDNVNNALFHSSPHVNQTLPQTIHI